MAELYLIDKTGGDKLESAFSRLQGEGHKVQKFQLTEDKLDLGDMEETPDLMLADLKKEDGRDFLNAVEKQAGDFPVVFPAQSLTQNKALALPADAMYIPMGCDLDVTFQLIRSVLSVWHSEA